ncbi:MULTISPECIES: hypothetical protein [Streptomyces]|uniref:Uncharacterized protein n=2 Tax=Streptomyces bottropensis TaxID=42235 RepID=M3FMG9_9ACTN|nr:MULTISPECIES: hypothetical protein [Streptomyces]EMF53279.1 hypothetical protein SBD_4823 [Streptomyces bottropensis ATCC 25435]WRY95209.1 hypothetical protein OG889_10995 [Streptomyces sp. NBC_00481]
MAPAWFESGSDASLLLPRHLQQTEGMTGERSSAGSHSRKYVRTVTLI